MQTAICRSRRKPAPNSPSCGDFVSFSLIEETLNVRLHTPRCECGGQNIGRSYEFSKLKELRNPCLGKKKEVGINLSPEVVDYFAGLAEQTGLPYRKLIDLYLLDCARKRKKLTMRWVA